MADYLLKDTDNVVSGQYYLGDGKLILAGSGTTVALFKTANSVSRVSPFNIADRQHAFFPGGKPIFEL